MHLIISETIIMRFGGFLMRIIPRFDPMRISRVVPSY